MSRFLSLFVKLVVVCLISVIALGPQAAHADGIGSATPNSSAKILSASGTNSTLIKGSSGLVFSYQFTNTAATARFVHFYNKASAPTVGTDVPIITVAIPAGGCVAGADLNGLLFSNGIAYSITAGASDTDSSSVSANDVVGVFSYK